MTDLELLEQLLELESLVDSRPPMPRADYTDTEGNAVRHLSPENARPSNTAYGLYEQGMSGVNTGIADLLGTPVDLTTSVLNAGISGVNNLTGTDLAPITDPLGGSQDFRALMSPFVSDRPPETTAERYANRIGREVGYGAPIAMMAGGSQLPKVMGINAAADTAAGVAGQTAREIAPENDTLDAIVSILAGTGTAAGAAARSRSKPPAPYDSTEEMFDAAGDMYSSAYSKGGTLTPEAKAELDNLLDRALVDASAYPELHKRAFAEVDRIKSTPSMTLQDLERNRSLIGRRVAGNADEADVGVALKKEIEAYLEGLDSSKLSGANPSEAVEELTSARALTHQAHKAKEIETGATRATTRAARTGRGGNVINTMRQNIGKIYDNEIAPLRPGKRSGYTPDEVAQMEDINFGTRMQNRGRLLAGMSPTTGALPAMFSTAGLGGAATGFAATGNPLYALAAAPSAAGMVAKGLTERSTRKQIEELLDIIRRGGTASNRAVSPAAARAMIAQMLSSGSSLPQY